MPLALTPLSIDLEPLDGESTYYEFHFEPEIGFQDQPVHIYRAHSLTSLFYFLTQDAEKVRILNHTHILSKVKQFNSPRNTQTVTTRSTTVIW